MRPLFRSILTWEAAADKDKGPGSERKSEASNALQALLKRGASPESGRHVSLVSFITMFVSHAISVIFSCSFFCCFKARQLGAVYQEAPEEVVLSAALRLSHKLPADAKVRSGP